MICKNSGNGILIDGSETTSNKLQGNYIGANADGASLGNGENGVLIQGDATFNLIGGTSDESQGNTIWYNASAGVDIESGQQDAIRMNSIYQNEGIGIDLGDDGVTANGVQTMDAGGPNNWQYMPVVTTEQTFDNEGNPTDHAALVMQGTPGSVFTVDLYSAELGGSYYSGKKYLGCLPEPVQIGANGYAQSTVDGTTVPWVDITGPVGGTDVSTITATATDSAGNTSEFSLPEMTATVTNMAPITMYDVSHSLLQLVPAYGQFDVESAVDRDDAVVIAASQLGGEVQPSGQHGPEYAPDDTYSTNSPWDPYNPYGGGTDDDSGGGASFTATFPDANGKTLTVDVRLVAGHSGYEFYHKSGDPNSNNGNWVGTTVASQGGLMLVGGGDHPTGAYNWFGSQAAGGDIVVIDNKDNQAELKDAVDTLFGQFGGSCHAIDGFSFGVDASDFLTDSAQQIVNDITRQDPGADGQGVAHEFIDKLAGAAGVYFCGGDQWVYVQLLEPGAAGTNLASKIISDGNNSGTVVVGGTSAGLAILGQYVFSSRWSPDGLTSNEMLTNAYNSKFYHDGTTAIVSDVLGLNLLTDQHILTETHFTDPEKASTDASGLPVYRLGRLVEFMGSITLSQTVKGIAVDNNTALAIDNEGNCGVYGTKDVYFANADPSTFSVDVVNPAPGIHQINVANIDLRQWLPGQTFKLAQGWNYDPIKTDVIAVLDGNVFWLEGEPFF